MNGCHDRGVRTTDIFKCRSSGWPINAVAASARDRKAYWIELGVKTKGQRQTNSCTKPNQSQILRERSFGTVVNHKVFGEQKLDRQWNRSKSNHTCWSRMTEWFTNHYRPRGKMYLSWTSFQWCVPTDRLCSWLRWWDWKLGLAEIVRRSSAEFMAQPVDFLSKVHFPLCYRSVDFLVQCALPQKGQVLDLNSNWLTSSCCSYGRLSTWNAGFDYYWRYVDTQRHLYIVGPNWE